MLNGLWQNFGLSSLDSAAGGLMSNLGMVDYAINPLARAGYEDFWNDSYSVQSTWNLKNAQELAKLQYGYWKDSQLEGPTLRRQALEKAGYNPILAVSSAGGQPFSSSLPSMPSAQSGPGSARSLNTMAYAQQAAMVDQINAQTDLIKKKTIGEGWQVKTLTRSEALGLGAHLGKVLGFNFNDSSQTTFLVAYNPITGELRNLGDTASGLGTTGEPNDAATVESIGPDGSVTLHYRDGSDKPYKATYDHTKGYNLPR